MIIHNNDSSEELKYTGYYLVNYIVVNECNNKSSSCVSGNKSFKVRFNNESISDFIREAKIENLIVTGISRIDYYQEDF